MWSDVYPFVDKHSVEDFVGELLVTKLNERERTAFLGREFFDLTYSEIGHKFKVSAVRARQIHFKSLRKLRKHEKLIAKELAPWILERILRKEEEERAEAEAQRVEFNAQREKLKQKRKEDYENSPKKVFDQFPQPRSKKELEILRKNLEKKRIETQLSYEVYWKSLADQLPKGIEVRGEGNGRFLLFPPHTHCNGGEYQYYLEILCNLQDIQELRKNHQSDLEPF